MGVCLVLAAGLMPAPLQPAFAQRARVARIQTPSTPGRFFGGQTPYSFGLGTLEGGSPGSDSGLLRSSITNPPRFRLSASGRPPLPPPAPPRVRPTRSRAIAPHPPLTRVLRPAPPAPPTGPLVEPLVAPAHSGAMPTTLAYLQAIGAVSPDVLTERVRPLTSLVPDQPGVYRTYMRRGEEHFRAGRFAQAFDEFRIAHDVSAASVESLLSLAHTRFAAGAASYPAASFYVQRALRKLPELPLAPLRPSALFGDERTYRLCVERLDGHLRRYPRDAGAQLLSAYFAWFEGRREAAEQALARASAARRAALAARPTPAVGGQSDSLLEAVGIFERSIGAGTEPSSTTRPAGAPTSRPAGAPAAP